MVAIFLSSAAPIAAGTFFQMRMRMTTTIASATHWLASIPRAVGSAWPAPGPPCSSTATCVSPSPMVHRRLHGLRRAVPADREPGELRHHLLGGLGRDILDIGESSLGRLAEPRLGGLGLGRDLLVRRPDPGLGIARGRLLGFMR